MPNSDVIQISGRPRRLVHHRLPRELYECDGEIDGQPAHVFGWAYWTLDGHFEQGEMHYEVRKWLDSGDVEFRLRAVSRPAETGPWMLRTGFRLVGRPISCASTVRSAGASGD